MRKVDALRQLQEVDSQLDMARATINRLSTEIGNRGALDQRAHELHQVEAELHEVQAVQLDLDLQAADRRAKITDDEGKLYSGKITNSKELSNLTDEVAQDKRQLATVEDKLIEVLERVEKAQNAIKTLGSALRTETAAWKASQRSSVTALNEARATATRLEARSALLSADLTPRDRSTYDSLRRQKGGSAVAIVQQRTCQACRVSLTPVQEQRARIGTDLITCHSCGRILYVPLS